ncbi:MAG TPA: type I methionyl aminopeptidase [Caldilineaceae bacterium]|nr:type I methionyl aminopeptidase [Caldilineaceae bacterium]
MFKRGARKLLRRPQGQGSQKSTTPILKSPREIQIMREAGRIVARVHAALREAVRPGASTWDLDQVALDVLQRYGATSAFLGYRGYPAHICASVNHELVHGIPHKDRILHEGDIISIDVGSRYRGFVGDSAWTYAVGEVDATASQLMQVTEASLYAGIEQAVAGNRVVDISRAVQRSVEANQFHVVREYTGHGVGRQMHEAPQVLNYVANDADSNMILTPGMVIAIEPMVQANTWETKTLRDNWTVVSKDNSLAAHYEHTVAITNTGPEILTLP